MNDSVRLKWLLSESDVRAGAEAEVLPLLSVSISWGVRRREAAGATTRAASEDLSNYKVCRVGDLVINRMRAFQGALGIAPEDGIVSPDYAVLTVDPSIDSRWLNYFLTSGSTVSTMASLVRGIGGTEAGNVRTPRLNMADLLSMVAPLLSAAEQCVIADYLDRETTRIDTLIEEQQRLIEMLRERRRLVVTNAIPPRPSLGSGADKLGRTTRIGNGSTPRREKTEYWDSGDIPWLNSSVVNQARVSSAVEFVTATALAECHLPIVSPGSVLVGLTGQGKTRGMATILDIEATVNQHLAYVTPDRGRWWPGYLLWLLAASYDDLRRISEENGSTKGGLTCEALKQLRVVIPSIEEQRQIAFHLDEQTSKTDALIAESERLIELARERRSALITAAVNGQIDVREVA
ncbi:restriction endonuclease subunit S [Streptomyces sp. NPDC012421]|uniref:restriction endonuclease subunit S n=1 Tax=Streptomyces sp. NPDC012421 TaxID=3364832 RepID=UPI0036F16BF2